MTDAVPAGWRNLVDWQRLVAGPLNKISQGYPFPLWGAEPADTEEGYTFYDTADHAPKWFDGTNYNQFGKAILEGLGDPGGDRLVFWDDSAGAYAHLVPGTGLSISDTTISVSLSTTWTQIATSTPSGVATVNFTSIPQTYGDLLILWSGLSHNSGSSLYPSLAVSANGTSYSNLAAVGEANTSGEASRGAVFIPNYRSAMGVMVSAITNDTASNNIDYVNLGWNLAWRVNGSSISAIRCAWDGSANFDAGTLTLFGR